MDEQRRAYLKTRKPFLPTVGETYLTTGGGEVICENVFPTSKAAQLRNTKSDWVFVAHGIGKYVDGKIDWNFSTRGYFREKAI